MQKVVTAGQAIVDGLVRNGVRHIFGIPGVHTYSLIDALAERQGELAYLGTRHEQGAAYMAYGYACSSGRVGAYTCVPGPGVLNTSAALSTAYAANAPVLCLTSEVFSHEIGRGHGILHELPDQLAILRGLTKWSARISHPSEAPRLVARAAPVRKCSSWPACCRPRSPRIAAAAASSAKTRPSGSTWRRRTRSGRRPTCSSPSARAWSCSSSAGSRCRRS